MASLLKQDGGRLLLQDGGALLLQWPAPSTGVTTLLVRGLKSRRLITRGLAGVAVATGGNFPDPWRATVTVRYDPLAGTITARFDPLNASATARVDPLAATVQYKQT